MFLSAMIPACKDWTEIAESTEFTAEPRRMAETHGGAVAGDGGGGQAADKPPSAARAYETGEHKPPVSLKRFVFTGLACPVRPAKRAMSAALRAPPLSSAPPR